MWNKAEVKGQLLPVLAEHCADGSITLTVKIACASGDGYRLESFAGQQVRIVIDPLNRASELAAHEHLQRHWGGGVDMGAAEGDWTHMLTEPAEEPNRKGCGSPLGILFGANFVPVTTKMADRITQELIDDSAACAPPDGWLEREIARAKDEFAAGAFPEHVIKPAQYGALLEYGTPRVKRPDQVLSKQQMAAIVKTHGPTREHVNCRCVIPPAEAASPPAPAEPAPESRSTGEAVASCDGRKSHARGPESPSLLLLRAAANGEVSRPGELVDRLVVNVAREAESAATPATQQCPESSCHPEDADARKSRWSLLHG